MTMSRNAKTKLEQRTKGTKPLVSGYSGQPITAQQYLGRGTDSQVTATAKKMEREGWKMTERGSFRRITRKG